MTEKPVRTVEELIASAPAPDKVPQWPGVKAPEPTGRRALPKVQRKQGNGPQWGSSRGDGG